MYIPLFALAFLTTPFAASLTAALVPLLSAVLTGMPPLYPPVAWIMSVEVSSMVLVTSLVAARFGDRNPVFFLFPVLVLGRFVNAALYYSVAELMDLPAGFLAGLSFFAAWPGVLLILVTTPAFVRLLKGYGHVGMSNTRRS